METFKLWWNNNKDLILKRVKSYLWRTGCMAGVAALNWLSTQLGMMGLPMWAVGLLGLAIGELVKWLNNNVGLFGRALKK